jgi:hypothetical protein
MFENMIPLTQVPTKIPIAVKTLRNWRSKGTHAQIFVKLGGKVFVDLDELAKIITRQQEKAKKAALRHDL